MRFILKYKGDENMADMMTTIRTIENNLVETSEKVGVSFATIKVEKISPPPNLKIIKTLRLIQNFSNEVTSLTSRGK